MQPRRNTFERIFVNRAIRAPQVRVVDEQGQQLGVMDLEEALAKASGQNLDLVQVTHKVNPPVCRITDYGKFLYWEKKKKKLSKPQSGGEIKSVRLRLGISGHDIETRANQAEKFLKKGHMVRVDMYLRGREKAMEAFAKDKMYKFLEGVAKFIPYKIEREVRKEPKGLSMLISKGVIKTEGVKTETQNNYGDQVQDQKIDNQAV